jgi:hypothetical protein
MKAKSTIQKQIKAGERLAEELPKGTVPTFVSPPLSDAEYKKRFAEAMRDEPLGPIPGREYITRIFTPHKHKDGDHIALRVYSGGALCDEGHTFMRCGVSSLREEPNIRGLPVTATMESCDIREHKGVLLMPRPDGWTQMQHVDHFCKAIQKIAELLEDSN